jgi:predicted RNA-binding Zn-ribbon protein involved in translation (DUF1610 family)
MKCPKCGKEMQKGFVPSNRGRLYWSPEDQRIPWNVAKLPKGSVVLSDFSITTAKKAEAFFCESCKIVILPVKDKMDLSSNE